MTGRSVRRVATLATVAAVMTGILAGCAARQAAWWGDLDTGLILEYRMPEGETLSYEMTSDFTQEMETMGQTMSIESTETLAFSVESIAKTEDGYRLSVTIDGMYLLLSTPQGDLEVDGESVTGGSFEMDLSRVGLESDLPDPSILQYSAGPQGDKSIIPGFSAMFPDFAGRPVLVGDNWPSTVEIIEAQENSNVTISFDVVNTLAGVEIIDGIECARITYAFTGSIEGTGEQQGMPWTVSSAVEGTGFTLFAIENGTFMADESIGTAEGAMVLETPGGEMQIPTSRTFTMRTELRE